MGKSRFLIITFVGFLAVLGEAILKKTLPLFLCGLLGFNSMACFFDWDEGRVNAAQPNIEESYLAATPQGEPSGVIKSISKWWATAGKDKLIDTTLKIEIEEKAKYQLNINIGGTDLVRSLWGLTLKSEAILKSVKSNKVIETVKFGVLGELTGKVEFSQELIPGNYEVKITNIEVPKKPIVEQFNFLLSQKINEKYQEKSRLKTLFIADRPEPNLSESQIEKLIDKYAPILHFDKGELNENKPELFTMPFSVSETWGQHWGNKTPKITGNSEQSIYLGQYTDNFPEDIKEPKDYEPAIYASVSENLDEKEIAINYYFHYPRSNWKKYGGENTHQGDWEGIAVFLKVEESQDSSFNLVPDRVAFSQHVKVDLSVLRNTIRGLGSLPRRFKPMLKSLLVASLIDDASTGGVSVPWEYVERPNNGNKTNVYVGLGAHASFPFKGITGFNRPPNKNDKDVLNGNPVDWVRNIRNRIASYGANQEFHKGDLSTFEPSPKQIKNLPRAGSIKLGDRNDWLLFPGFWGEKEAGHPEGNPPRGPMFLDWDYEIFGDKWSIGDDEGLGTRWLDPWEWSKSFDKITKGSNNINTLADQIIVIDETDLYSDEERSILRGGGNNDAYTLEDDGIGGGFSGSFIQDRGGVDSLSIKKDFSALPGGVKEISLSLCEGQPLERDGTALLINYDREGEPKYAKEVTVLDFFKNSTGPAEPGTGFIEKINDLTGKQIIDYFNNGRKDKSCEPEPKPKPKLEGVSGEIFGDPHLITFDRRRLSFQAVGEFIQAKSSGGNFEVQGRYKQVGRNASLADAVAVKLGRDRVGVYGQQNPPLRVNGVPTNIGDELLELDGGGQIYRSGSTYVIISPTGEGVKAQRVSAGDGSLTVEVVMPETRRGQVAGLLGNFNGDFSDDIQTRSGEVLPRNPNYEQLYKVFGKSWRISQEESLFDYAPGQTTATFTDLSFPTKIVRTRDFASNRRTAAERNCREAGVRQPELLEACIFDILVTEDNRFARVSANVEERLTSDIEATPSAPPNPINSAPELPIDFCVKNKTWTRPSESEHLKYFRAHMSPLEEHYNIPDEVILGSDQWTDDFIGYRYYWLRWISGLVKYSGVWALGDDLKGVYDCAEDFSFQGYPGRENTPFLTQMWIFSHEVQKVQWMGDRYLITVKPTGQGVQIFQFPKQGNDLPRKANPNEQPQSKNQGEPPPVEIVDETGSRISFCQDDPDNRRVIVCR